MYAATNVAPDPLAYFLQENGAGSDPRIRVSDVVLRVNHDPREVFSRLIRFATNSQWSHSALLYLLSDPMNGFDNTFLVEAMTTGIRVASWHNEVYPFEQFTVGIRRLTLDWYVETPKEAAQHKPEDPEDTHGIAYLRYVRGMAVDQINGLYSHNVVNELTALYIERIAKRYHSPEIANIAGEIAHWFELRDETNKPHESVVRFICSGLVQHSFFAALRWRIMNAMSTPESKDAAMSNLSNMQRIIFRVDPSGIMPEYIQDVQSGKLKISDPVPERVLNFLRTTTPADINNSTNLNWRYIIRNGVVWHIDEVADGYQPKSKDEADVLALITQEHVSSQKITSE